MLVPVILSGGVGSRLWPVSRQNYPKQCIPLTDQQLSLMQQTALRVANGQRPAAPLIVCNEEHRFLIAEQVRQVEVTPMAILLEPEGRNTAPAVALAAQEALASGADPVLLVLPADHAIADDNAFHQAVESGYQLAKQGKLVSFGVPARQPNTGYGYIRGGDEVGNGFAVEQFVEKPDAETARQYVDSGDYYWNCGIFMFRASQYLAELEQFEPDIFHQTKMAHSAAQSDLDFKRIGGDAFASCPGKSIDYAVMEHTANAVVVPLAAAWSDVGEWSALWGIAERDSQGNVHTGDVVTEDVSDCYIRAESRLVAALGIDNQVVVETPDAVLVMDKSRAQDVKKIVDKLKAESRSEAVHHTKVYRPWGSYESLVSGSRFQVKRIVVKPGCVLSLQMHHHRAEHWIVVSGSGRVTRGEEEFLLSEDQSTYIPIGTQHRLENPGHIPLELIEVQSGSYLGEDDIIRFEDVYGRTEEVEEG